MKRLSNRNILVLFLIFVAFLIVGSATLSFQTANAQNMTATTENATTADNATGAENATAEGSISARDPTTGVTDQIGNPDDKASVLMGNPDDKASVQVGNPDLKASD